MTDHVDYCCGFTSKMKRCRRRVVHPEEFCYCHHWQEAFDEEEVRYLYGEQRRVRAERRKS